MFLGPENHVILNNANQTFVNREDNSHPINHLSFFTLFLTCNFSRNSWFLQAIMSKQTTGILHTGPQNKDAKVQIKASPNARVSFVFVFYFCFRNVALAKNRSLQHRTLPMLLLLLSMRQSRMKLNCCVRAS